MWNSLGRKEREEGNCRYLTCNYLRINQLSLSQESNQKKDEKRKTKHKTDEQLSPEMVIKSVRAVRKGEGDYGGNE